VCLFLHVALLCRRRKLFPKFGTCVLMRASRPQEGRFAVVTIRRCGMRWTQRHERRCVPERTVKSRGRGPPMLGSSPSRCVSAVRPAPARWATEANKPGTPARARSSRNPLRRECRAISALPDDLWAFSFSAHEASRVRPAPGIPCPSTFRRDTNNASLGRKRAAGMRSRVFHCRPGQARQSRARSGTHNHRTSFCEGQSHSASQPLLPVVMGPRVRGDDSGAVV